MERKEIAVEWDAAPREGHVEVIYGHLVQGEVARGQGTFSQGQFASAAGGLFRLTLEIEAEHLGEGAYATRVSIGADANPFTFFLRDVHQKYPILIPAYGVAVTEAEDRRSYAEILRETRAKGLVTSLQRIDLEPEESYEEAARNTRHLRCPTWLGLGRDMRLFEVGLRTPETIYDSIQPRFHGERVALKETDGKPCRYYFLLGRGWGCTDRTSRRLEEGVLPILRQRIVDDDIVYDCTAFVTLEQSGLSGECVRGTHYLVADAHGAGHMFTEEQKRLLQSLLPEEMNQPEETVLYFRAQAVNTARVPRYAFFKAPWPTKAEWWGKVAYSFQGATGQGVYPSGGVFCVSRLNGRPLPQEEVSVLIGPGEAAEFEFYLPHRPIPPERALRLGALDLSARLEECRRFWRNKLQAAAKVELPERRIQEMVQAGLLHLDLVAYGLEPEGPLAPTIGVYSPIGSESSPIMQFTDFMGRHDVAERMLGYFLEKQHEDGFIQNFGGYMLETGCALWSLGEHYRYTRDEAWAARIAPKVLKSCAFILNWRNRNKRENLRGKGYGMMEGKVADPEDEERIFMLNGYAYLGLSRAAEMLAGCQPAEAARLKAEAEALKADIRTAFLECLARGPVVPLGDGTWCPTLAGWAAYPGPVCLHAEGGNWTTHGTVTARDSLVGPLYLVFQEVIVPDEQAATFLVHYNAELFTLRNVGFSQPYYHRHSWVNLMRGEVKPFLKAYYNTFAGLADRETHTFWEHYFHASPHKTHEEGWFLMETRWMLCQERGQILRLLPGIPRAWLEDGQRIALSGVATYFGPVTLEVVSHVEQGFIEAKVTCDPGRKPERVELRLPHPLGRRAASVEGGRYEAGRETVIIEEFRGEGRIVVRF
jgi:hypothetical protein